MDLEGYEVFIDPMVLQGVLVGVLLALAGLWLLVLRSALWRAWLRQEHGPALTEARARLGLIERRVHLRPMIQLEQQRPDGTVQLRLTAWLGRPRATIQAQLLGHASRAPAHGAWWLADWAEEFLGPEATQP